jgi:hypothetical protein
MACWLVGCSSVWQSNQPDSRPATNQRGAQIQQAATTGILPKPLFVIVLPLDDTGFADARYLNPRNPPHVLTEGIEFVNRTSDRTFVVTFSLDKSRLSGREQKELTNFADKNSDPHFRPLECEGDKCTVTLFLGPNQRVSVQPFLLNPGLVKFQLRFFDEAEPPSNALGYVVKPQPIETIPPPAAPSPGPPPPSGQCSVVATNTGPVCNASSVSLSATSSCTGVAYAWTGPNGFAAVGQQKVTGVSVPGTYTVTVADPNGATATTTTEVLTGTGTPKVVMLKGGADVDLSNTSQTLVSLSFDTGCLTDKEFKRLLKQSAEETKQVPKTAGVVITGQPSASPSPTALCHGSSSIWTVLVSLPSGMRALTAQGLFPTGRPTKLRPTTCIALSFTDVQRAQNQEPDDSLKITPAGSVGFVVTPQFPPPANATAPVAITETSPYAGLRRSHFPATAQLDITDTIGARFGAETSFAYRNADLGGKDTASLPVTTPKYKFSLFALNGMILDFGKLGFASPSNKIAVNEAGEGLRLTLPTFRNGWGALSASRIIKRAPPVPQTQTDDGPASVNIVQLSNINLLRGWNGEKEEPEDVMSGELPSPLLSRLVRGFRTANLIALVGKDQKLNNRHHYSTWGGEAIYVLPEKAPTPASSKASSTISGAVAFYKSHRASSSSNGVIGRGSVGLVRGTWNHFLNHDDPPKYAADYTVTALLGAGSRDDRKTARDEGYVGETQAFQPDTLFFGTFAAPLAAGAAAEAQGSTPTFSAGLGNKLYGGLLASTTRFSLLERLEKQLGTPDDEIVASSTTVAVHHYYSRNEIFGHKDLGWELDLTSLTESPKGVKVSLGLAYYRRGSAVIPIQKRNTLAFIGNITIQP